MKLTSRGFTLVELMIVIAIIGILAAALFPSMTGYLKRSRDTARTAALKDVSTALGGYYADKERYPNTSGGCIDNSVLDSNYMPKGVPLDPVTSWDNGCGANKKYGYGTGIATNLFVLVAKLENPNGGNYNAATAAGLTGTVSMTGGQIQNNMQRGTGTTYVLSN